MICFSFSFQGSNFVEVRIFSMLYMYKETPAVIFSLNFGFCAYKFVTSFIQSEIKRPIMKEVCEVDPKKLQTRTFGVKKFSRSRKTLVTSRKNEITLFNYFDHVLCVCMTQMLFICTTNLDEGSTKFIPIKPLSFLPV